MGSGVMLKVGRTLRIPLKQRRTVTLSPEILSLLLRAALCVEIMTVARWALHSLVWHRSLFSHDFYFSSQLLNFISNYQKLGMWLLNPGTRCKYRSFLLAPLLRLIPQIMMISSGFLLMIYFNKPRHLFCNLAAAVMRHMKEQLLLRDKSWTLAIKGKKPVRGTSRCF